MRLLLLLISVPLFLIPYSLFASPFPAFAAPDPNCALDYPVCYTSLPPGLPIGTCLNREVLHCTTATGNQGNWCCPTSLPPPTPCTSPLSCTQTPVGSNCQSQYCSYPSGGTGSFCCNTSLIPTPPAGSCTAVPGQQCLPSLQDCGEFGGRLVAGSCPSHWFCCDLNPPGTPAPTPPGGPGGSPGGYTPGGSADPRTLGFDPLKYPCDQTADPEFHPQRPYPASPCHPLIPDSSRLSFSCGKSLDAQGAFEFPPTVDVNILAAFDPNTAIPGTLYRCDANCFAAPINPAIDSCEVCAIKRVGFDISLDLRNARIPILGNTQDPLDDATKVNNYLNWYFNGTVQHSEQQDVLTYLPPSQQTSSNFQCMGKPLADYMNKVIELAGNLPHIKLLSPAFNIGAGDSSFTDIWNSMTAAGARWNDLDGIAANAYNTADNTITGYVSSVQSLLQNRPVYLTEIGMYEITSGTPRSTALSKLKSEISKIQSHQLNIQAGLLFNTFNTNPDPAFQYNVMSDPEITAACNGPCGNIGINSAVYYSQSDPFYLRAKNLSLGYTLEIANADSNPLLPSIMPGINAAHANGLIPIIRIGVSANSGGFDNPVDYADFLTRINDLVASSGFPTKTVYAIAGPNEPNAETWATPTCAAAGAGTSTLSGIDRLINYSGPLKKLLPQLIQKNIKDVLNAGPIGSSYHDYFVINGKRLGNPFLTWSEIFKYVPFSSLEDTTGEFTIGLIPEQQPGNPGDQGVGAFGSNYFKKGQVIPDTSGKNAIFLTIKPEAGDRTDSRLYFPHLRSLDVLSRLLASLFRPNDKFNSKDTNAVVNDLPDDTNSPQYPQYDYLRPGENSRNTQVIPGSPAPAPLINYGGYDQLCDLSEVRVNPGDSLVGSTVTARLGYAQIFRYTPQPAPTGCGQDLDICTTTADCCSPLRCEDICQHGQCNDRPPGTIDFRCIGGGPPPVELPTEARAGVFVKSPLLDQLYATLVTGSQSIFNRFFPKRDSSEDPRPGGRDIPASADAVYSGTGVGFSSPLTRQTYEPPQTDTSVTSGKHTPSAQIYFKHLGSIMDYFLGAGTDAKNLQKLLRPLGLSSGSVGSPPPVNTNLQQIAAQYHVPAEFLDAIWYLESGRSPSGSNCSNCASAACGPMQIGPVAYNDVTDPSENLDRCNLPDAFIIAARVLLDKKYCTLQTIPTCTSLHASPATAYLTIGSISSNEYYPAARYHGSDGCWGNTETKARWNNCTDSANNSTCYSYCDAVHCVVTNPNSPPLPQPPSFTITNPQCSKQTYVPPGLLQ